MAPNNMLCNTRHILDFLAQTADPRQATPMQITALLGIPQRRVYDILAVCETLQIVEKLGKRYQLITESRPLASKGGAIPQLALAVLQLLRREKMKPQTLINVLRSQNFPPRRCYDVLSVMEAAGVIGKDEKQDYMMLKDYEFVSPGFKVLEGASMRSEICDDELVALLVGLRGM